MENELNAMLVSGLYLGLGLMILFLGWGLFAFGCWMEKKINDNYLAKTRTFIRPRGIDLWY